MTFVTRLRHRCVLAVFLCVALTQSACTQNTPVLSGKLEVHPDWAPVVYLYQPTHYREILASYEGKLIDSARLAPDGSFAFFNDGWLQHKSLFVLFVQPKGKKFKNEIAEPSVGENIFPLVLAPGEAANIHGKINALTATGRLQGGHRENYLLADLCSFRRAVYVDTGVEKTEEDDVLHEGGPGVQSFNKNLDQYLDTASALFPVLTALRWREPDNEFRDQPERHIAAYRRLLAAHPEHPWLQELGFYLQPEKVPVLQGEKMPDFALPTPQGDTLRLGDIKARLLLVDFWASWCAPCRKEAKTVIGPLYNTYRDQGFEVLGVSIDGDRGSWTRAIEKDQANWLHVSDLLGDASPVRQMLKFEYIPANYLLDGEGRLIARNVHGGALTTLVKRYMEE